MKNSETLGLKESELEEIINILASFENVEWGVVYGSRAKGTHKPFSDIDLTVYGSGLTYMDILRISDNFEESSLPYMVDISDFSKLSNPDLIDHIRRRGMTIFDRSQRSDHT